MINRVPVESSNLRSVGYDPDAQMLEIEFRNGGICQYYGVPETVYLQLMAASSKGKFFHVYIKDIYPYAKIR